MICTVKQGSVCRSYVHNGQTYVAVEVGKPYVVSLRNGNWNGRKLTVVSVDGINVIDGADAGYSGTGYVLAPGESIDIPGWLRSGQQAAAFEVADASASYAAKTGRGTSNVGVIGVAVFDERQRPVWHGGYCGGSFSEATLGGIRCNSTPSRSILTKSVGTAFGKTVDFRTSKTTFDKASETPSQIITIRYGTREMLREWGVPIDLQEQPNAFPAEAHVGYCQPPKR